MLEAVEEENAVGKARQRIVRRGEAQLVALCTRAVHEHCDADERREPSRAVPHQDEVEVRRMRHNVGTEGRDESRDRAHVRHGKTRRPGERGNDGEVDRREVHVVADRRVGEPYRSERAEPSGGDRQLACDASTGHHLSVLPHGQSVVTKTSSHGVFRVSPFAHGATRPAYVNEP
jgi:hypothetical protein